jgi:thiamine-phosphate pyrophosphorylase
MDLRKRLNGVCLITDRDSCPLTCEEMVRMALMAGVRWVQYRDKDRDRLCFYRTALKLRRITRDFDACFIVNDHADIAQAVDADGVHLGQDDLPVAAARKILGPDRIVGISTHSLDEALAAEGEGADYVGYGPIYETSTKPDADTPKGPDEAARIAKSLRIPVVAIGGITAEALPTLMKRGVSGVAVASGILKGHLMGNVARFLSSVH